MLRKWASVLALGAILVGASGCGPSGGSAAGGPSASAGASGKKLKIGVSIPAADHGWTAGVVYWAKQAMERHPEIEWSFTTSADPAAQTNDIETMMTKGIDGLVVLATESAPLTPTAEKVHERGIFLVNVDRGFLKPVADIFIEGDNEAFGRKSAEYMVKRLNGKGQIVVLEGIPSTVNTARVEAAMEVFKKYPEIKILDSQSGMWNKEKALNVMQALLTKHKHIDAVWAQDDDMALGAEKAIKDAGRQGEMWMLGGAGMKDIIKRVKDGDKMFPADITYPPSMIGAGIELAVASLSGGSVDKVKQYMPRHLKLDVDLVEPGNADQFYFPDSVY